MKKVFLLISVVLPCVFFSEEVVGESAQSDYNSSAIAADDTYLKSNGIKDSVIKDELRNLSFCLNENKRYNKEISFRETLINSEDFDPRGFTHESYVKINDDMELIEGSALAAHSAYLTNNTGIDQTMYTAGFEYTSTDSISTQTSHTAGVDTTTTVEMKFPIASGSVSVNAKYEFNHTKEEVSTTEKKWTIPPMPFTVPAGHKFAVNWMLETGVAKGSTKLISLVNATIPYKRIGDTCYGLPLGEALSVEKELQRSTASGIAAQWRNLAQWEKVGSAGLKTWADATFSAKFGTDMVLVAKDVTKVQTNKKFGGPAKPVVVAKIPLDIVPEIVE